MTTDSVFILFKEANFKISLFRGKGVSVVVVVGGGVVPFFLPK